MWFWFINVKLKIKICTFRYYEESIKDLTDSNKKISETYQKQRDEIAKKTDEINRLNDQITLLPFVFSLQKRTFWTFSIGGEWQWLANFFETLFWKFY